MLSFDALVEKVAGFKKDLELLDAYLVSDEGKALSVEARELLIAQRTYTSILHYVLSEQVSNYPLTEEVAQEIIQASVDPVEPEKVLEPFVSSAPLPSEPVVVEPVAAPEPVAEEPAAPSVE